MLSRGDLEVDEVVVCTVCCHSKPSRFKQASTVQMVRTEFFDGLTHPVRQHDPTAGGRQLVGVPHFQVVALLISRLENLSHSQLDQPPVSFIDQLHLIRAPWWQQPKQNITSSLSYFLDSSVVFPCRLSAKKMDCSTGFTPEPSVTAVLNVLSMHRLQ